MKKQIIIIYFIIVLLPLGYSQNQANIWYFGRTNGLDFNSGYPEYLGNCPDWVIYTTSICDTNGNLLFYTNGWTIWNKDLEIMQNGTGLEGHTTNRQPAVICEDPGNPNRYYLFTVGIQEIYFKGLAYNIIDMTLDGGRGAVVEKNSRIPIGANAKHKITAVKKANNKDYWIVTRLSDNPNYDTWACFSLTSAGVDPNPVLSQAIGVFNNLGGPVKVSQDRKKLISVQTNAFTNNHGSFEVCDFNAQSGAIIHRFYIKEHNHSWADFGIYGMEISPDSKLLYISFDEFTIDPNGNFTYIYQYDLTKSDSLSFLNSRLIVNTDNNVRDLQLGPDGKIYASSSNFDPLNHRYVSVINDVWKKGAFCDFQKIAVDVGVGNSTNLPSFPSELLYRFVWKGGPCAKTLFNFRHRFIPEPDSIVWNFGDGITSTDFNPTHVFQSGGNYEVHAHVVYPDGRVEETSREVEVLAVPEPWLGKDTLLCSNATIELNAGSGFTQYIWNEQFPPGNQYYTITDTGYYTVRVKNDLNCYGSDTVHVGLYPKVFLDITQAETSNTTCNNNTGAIRGILVSPAAIIEWRDGSGNLVGSEIDISSLAVGNYLLTIIDTTGCITEVMPSFTINNTDSDLIIESADGTDASCGQANGSISVQTSVFSDLLEYSIDDGNSWHDNFGNFQNVTPGNYLVRVIDKQGCEAVYPGNPVWVYDSGGPAVISIDSTAATGSNAGGTITITAIGDSLYYQLNGGVAQNSGYFEGLAADLYSVTITDKYGCDTTVTVTILSETGNQLSALAGNARQCLYKIATSELKVSNLNGVKDFKVTVLFNNLLLDCIGTNQKFHNDLLVTEFTNRIELEWHGAQALTLSDTVSLVHIIFETRQTGVADINWDLSGSSYFRDENGLPIPCDPIDGEVMISDPPVLVTNGDKSLCEGAFTVISGDVFLGVPPYELEWTKPDGSTTSDTPIWLFDLGAEQSGNYIISVTDDYGCNVKDTVTLIVIPPPTANFPKEPIPFENQYTLEAPQGYTSYEWNTGETNYFITVTQEGEYSVIIKTTEGCESRDTAMLVDVAVPIYVPNAFTPNGDGLNDTFKPIITKPDLASQYHLSIYNRWGQCFFETSDPAKGWDGKDELPGVYNWVVSYRDGMGKVNQLKGVVTLIK